MQVIPVDLTRLGDCLCVIAPDLRRTHEGVPRTDREGRSQWVVGVSVGQLGRRAADLIDVVVTVEPQGVTLGGPVVLESLEGIQWDMEGRKGIAWRAAAIRPGPVPNSAPPATGRGKSASAGGER